MRVCRPPKASAWCSGGGGAGGGGVGARGVSVVGGGGACVGGGWSTNVSGASRWWEASRGIRTGRERGKMRNTRELWALPRAQSESLSSRVPRHHLWSIRIILPSLILSIRVVLPAAKKNSVSACARSSAHIMQMTTTFNATLRAQEGKVPRGLEPRSLDSESRVLTVTPWDQL